MKTAIQTLTLVIASMVMSSFSGYRVVEFVGTYGVCSDEPSAIVLTINPDQTFYYRDFSHTHKHVVAEGTWTVKGNKVMLKAEDPDLEFHSVWMFEENGQVAKSRRGLAFYRLIRT